jgi:predicted RNase H-like HicB family nuclease
MTSTGLPRHVILEPDEDGGYHVYCPSLPGCHSQGDTVEEALANIKETIEQYREVLQEDGLRIPAAVKEIL